jgi:predicted metal-dependent phosphoesterase TrpH
VLKLELHSHTDEDPQDLIPYTAQALIDRAADLGYHALAITLHDRQLPLTTLTGYARERGITLVPGIERTIQGKHVLLLNFSRASEGVRSFDDLARLKARESGLVVAPHPFYPLGSCLREWMDVHPDLFDAVEYNGMFTRSLNFNVAAERWARAHGKPIVGNGDVHQLDQLGTTWTWVDADADPDAICDAIRAGKVELEAQPHSTVTAARIMGQMLAADIRRERRRWLAQRRCRVSDTPREAVQPAPGRVLRP